MVNGVIDTLKHQLERPDLSGPDLEAITRALLAVAEREGKTGDYAALEKRVSFLEEFMAARESGESHSQLERNLMPQRRLG